MKRLPPRRVAAMLALGCLFLPAAHLPALQSTSLGEPDDSFRGVLLSRARALEQRGRLDLAKGEWGQVLAIDSGNAEALAGLVRAARAEGRPAEATQYLTRLRAAHPQSPELARLDSQGKVQGSGADLAEAARLEGIGDHRGAFALYRRVYGLTPPPGSPALAYYGAEAATDDGRPQAIAGLRALTDRYPADSRYPVALGRVLLRSPRTRAEGRTLLERYPGNGEAVAALRIDSNAGSTEEHASLRAPALPVAKPSPAIPMPSEEARPLRRVQAPVASIASTVRSVSAGGREVRHQAFASQEQAGFAALNSHRVADAEQIFAQILAQDPTNPRALAGVGYLRVTTGDLKSAVNYFERAQENGDRSLALTRALVNTQYELARHNADTARTQGNLGGAESQYRAVLRERPSDPDALNGLAQLLLQSGHAADAIPVYTRLTEIRPLSPEAWRGLVIAQASAGRGSNALATDAHVPADAKAPLANDSSYLQALSTARAAQGTLLARAEPLSPSPLMTAPASAKPLPATPVVPAPAPAPSTHIASPAASAPQSASASTSPPAGPPSPAVTAAPVTAATAPGSTPGQPSGRRTLPPETTAYAQVPSSTRPEAPSTSARNTAPERPGRKPGRRVPAPTPPAPTLTASAPDTAAPLRAPVPPAPAVAIASERVTQAGTALTRGDNARAAELYRAALAGDPDRAEAWRGLVQALHAAGRDGEAVGALAQMPEGPHTVLERDATFQSAAGAVYLATARPGEALRALVRAQEVFASQRLQPPLDLVLRLSTLLAARNDDGNLYRELMYLGERPDMSDTQRRDVQMIWTSWAVRRARALAAAGEQRRAVVILNAAAEAFAGNKEVLSAVAGGYAGVGLPREAVALLKAQDLGNAPARELEAAIAAGIAAHDYRAAGNWARLGQERFPADPEMLTAVAELEQARGHQGRAVELTGRARTLAPPQDPAAVLTAELREAPAGHGWQVAPGGQLATLLSPMATVTAPGPAARPFLPAAPGSAAATGVIAPTPVLSTLAEPAQ